jgi:hypothetical protein
MMIASGAFEESQEMMTRCMGPTAKYIRPATRGGYQISVELVPQCVSPSA